MTVTLFKPKRDSPYREKWKGGKIKAENMIRKPVRMIGVELEVKTDRFKANNRPTSL